MNRDRIKNVTPKWGEGGITIGGVPLKEYLESKEEKEKESEVSRAVREISNEKVGLVKRTLRRRVYYEPNISHKQDSTAPPVTTLTTAQIEEEYGMQDGRPTIERVISILKDGEQHKIKEIIRATKSKPGPITTLMNRMAHAGIVDRAAGPLPRSPSSYNLSTDYRAQSLTAIKAAYNSFVSMQNRERKRRRAIPPKTRDSALRQDVPESAEERARAGSEGQPKIEVRTKPKTPWEHPYKDLAEGRSAEGGIVRGELVEGGPIDVNVSFPKPLHIKVDFNINFNFNLGGIELAKEE